MAGIPLTEARRSQLLEQLLRQQNRPRQISSSIQLAAELGAQLIRQKKVNKLRAAEAAAEDKLVKALGGQLPDKQVTLEGFDGVRSETSTIPGKRVGVAAAVNRLPIRQQLEAAQLQNLRNKSAGNSPFAKINPKDFTQDSIDAFENTVATGRPDFGSLVAQENKPKRTRASFIDADTGQAHAGSFDGELYRTSAGDVIRNASPIAPAAGQKDLQNNRQAFRPIEAATADSLGEIDNLIGQISAAPNPETLISVLGTATRGISAIANQARSAAAIFSGVKAGQSLKAVVNGKTVNETALFDPGLYDFGSAAIGSAAVQSNILNLAYSIARTQDPGGRLSDRDVQTFITVITGGDVPQTLSKLKETRRRTVKTFRNDAISRDLQDRLGSFEQRFGISLDTASGLSPQDNSRLDTLGL